MSQTHSNDATKWGRLLALAGGGQSGWLPDDLAQMWRHQLNAPLEVELPEAFAGQADGNHPLPAPRTFGGLLNEASPPLVLLRLVKSFAKERRVQASFPSEIATALYYAAIAVALSRHGERITGLDDASLCRGFQWTVRLSWLDESTRGVIESAIQRASAG